MPHAEVNGASLYYEVTGSGDPLVFCHEFAGDYRSWAPQVGVFSERYQCITYNYRGFPPSGVPDQQDSYSQEILIADLLGLLNVLEIERAHIVGLSMGGSVALNFALTHPKRCRSAVVAGCGSGSTNREQFEKDVARIVELLRTRGMEEFAEIYSLAPNRLPFKKKDQTGWELFRRQLAEHSAEGSAKTMLGVQLARPTIFSLEAQLATLSVPILLIVGDEDEPCIDPGIFMKRRIPNSGLLTLPQSGHTINLEEPETFNGAVADFLGKVEAGTWMSREQVTTSMLPTDRPAGR
jgi:pimeloyl-ACP methyl ester carboxylesterase